MNTDTSLETPNPSPESQETETASQNPGQPPSTPGKHRSHGKVARLPNDLREQVNFMIRDGVSYPRIIEHIERSLPEPLEDPISEQNLTNWKNGGHQVWLREQEWRDEILEARDNALRFPGGDDQSRLEQVTLKMASMRLFQLFRHLEPAAFAIIAQQKPEAYVRLFSALPRITRESLQYQKYRDACAQARAELQKLHDPKRKLSDSERHAIVRNVDEILGLVSEPAPEATPPPDPSPASETSGSINLI